MLKDRFLAVTILATGERVQQPDFAQFVKTEVRRIGLDYREEGCYRRGQPKTITGVIVTDNNLALPNRRHQALIDCLLR